MNTKFHSSRDFAAELDIPVFRFDQLRRDNKIPAPDTVFQKMPYWFSETVEAFSTEWRNAKTQAIRQAWGYDTGGHHA